VIKNHTKNKRSEVKMEELFELVEEIEDVKGKLEDCLETIKLGKNLDSMQEAFLKLHNIL
jgi:exonuclease VII small subunit